MHIINNLDLLPTNTVINHFLSLRDKSKAPICQKESLKPMCNCHYCHSQSSAYYNQIREPDFSDPTELSSFILTTGPKKSKLPQIWGQHCSHSFLCLLIDSSITTKGKYQYPFMDGRITVRIFLVSVLPIILKALKCLCAVVSQR